MRPFEPTVHRGHLLGRSRDRPPWRPLVWRDGELLAARGEPEAQLGRGTGLRRWGTLPLALLAIGSRSPSRDGSSSTSSLQLLLLLTLARLTR